MATKEQYTTIMSFLMKMNRDKIVDNKIRIFNKNMKVDLLPEEEKTNVFMFCFKRKKVTDSSGKAIHLTFVKILEVKDSMDLILMVSKKEDVKLVSKFLFKSNLFDKGVSYIEEEILRVLK
jgi:uncharacterized protein (UPF0216 family)